MSVLVIFMLAARNDWLVGWLITVWPKVGIWQKGGGVKGEGGTRPDLYGLPGSMVAGRGDVCKRKGRSRYSARWVLGDRGEDQAEQFPSQDLNPNVSRYNKLGGKELHEESIMSCQSAGEEIDEEEATTIITPTSSE